MKFFSFRKPIKVVPFEPLPHNNSKQDEFLDDQKPYVLLSLHGQNEFPIHSFFAEKVYDERYSQDIQAGELQLHAHVPTGQMARLTRHRRTNDVYLLKLSCSEDVVRSRIAKGTFRLSEAVDFYCSAASYLKSNAQAGSLEAIKNFPPSPTNQKSFAY